MDDEPTIYRFSQDKILQVEEILTSCTLCPQQCRVNRLQGETGKCKSTAITHCFDAILHYGDELEITPNYAVSLSGCNLGCSYCIAAPQSWDGLRGIPLAIHALAGKIEKLYRQGYDKVHFLGGEPVIHLLTILKIAQYFRPEIKIIVNSNFYWDHKIIPYLTDWSFLAGLKYGNNQCARDLSGVSDYWQIVTQNILAIHTCRPIIIRHLLLPGHFDCCFVPIVEWISCHCPELKISLYGSYVPPTISASSSGMGRFLHPEEFHRAEKLARQRKLRLVS